MKSFGEVALLEETHGLDCPPYERIAVCPHCRSTDFVEYNPSIERLDVAAALLPALACLNRYWDSIVDMYGPGAENDDFKSGTSIINDFLSEAFEYMPDTFIDAAVNVRGDEDVQRLISYLEE